MQANRLVDRRTKPYAASLSPRRLICLGGTLLLTSWAIAWFGPEPISWYTFFPLWLGYILAVDGLNRLRTGTSLLSRDAAGFVGLFLFSAPFWWMFEAINERLGSWHYRLPIDYPPLVYGFLASLAFSTVVPALFETAELYRSFTPLNRPIYWLRIAPSRTAMTRIALTGAVAMTLVLLFPEQAFPLTWLALFFIADPIADLLGHRSLSRQVAVGRWDTVLCLFAAGMTCGFLWEMWNYRSMPKWEYHVPYVGFGRIFEMPILGYGSYLPFALEIFSLWALAAPFLPGTKDSLIRFDSPVSDSSL